MKQSRKKKHILALDDMNMYVIEIACLPYTNIVIYSMFLNVNI